MDRKRGMKTEKSPLRLTRGGRIAVAVVAVLLAAFLFFLIFAPMLSARRQFSRALRLVESFNDGTVLLTDPYVEGGLLPDARETLLEGDEALLIADLLADALSDCFVIHRHHRLRRF